MAKPVYLYVTPFFPSPTRWRGSYCYDFVKALIGTNAYQVEVFTSGDGADYVIDGLTVHTFKMLSMPSNIFPFLTQGVNSRRFLKAVRKARVRLEDVAVCHGNSAEYSIYPLVIKRNNPLCKTLLHHHSLASFGFSAGKMKDSRLYRFFQAPILRRYHRAIDIHVFISEVCHRYFVEDSGYDPLNYRILHNGVDETLFKKRVCGEKGNTFVIGTVANIQRAKGFETTARALARIGSEMSNWEWRIVGSGSEMAHLKALIAEPDIAEHVKFHAEVQHRDLVDFYHGIDLYVMPSYWEGFGCVYTESYACGVPFVACKTNNGIVDLAPDAWLIEKGDDARLSKLILSAYQGRFPILPLKGEWRIRPLVEDFVKGL